MGDLQWNSAGDWIYTRCLTRLNFIVHELNNPDNESGNLNVNANTNLKSSSTVEQAAFVFDSQYERSSGAHLQKRIQEAYRVLQLTEGTAV